MQILISLDSQKRIKLKECLIIPDKTIGSVEETIIQRESERIVKKRLNNEFKDLTPRQQEVLFLKFHLNYTNELICEIMNINYQSARNLLYEAIKTLRSRLHPKIS